MQKNGKDSLRSKVWKLLLRLKKVDVTYYAQLATTTIPNETKSASHDTFRSGAKSIRALGKRVPIESLERSIKCVFTHYGFKYEQAFAIIMSVFLYVMDEVSAFHCFCRWRNQFINKYFDAVQVQANVSI